VTGGPERGLMIGTSAGSTGSAVDEPWWRGYPYGMKSPLVLFCVLGFIVGEAAVAQPQQAIVSPEVGPDRSVTFRLRAPAAQRVQLQCEGIGMTNLEKDDRGVWSFTSTPLEPDIYAYSFNIDGLRIADPNNAALKYNLQNNESLLHVPGTSALPWEVRNVPHGELHRHYYQSAIAGDYRDFIVYTPPGYNPTSMWRSYPVLYLLHGYSDDATAWTSVGCANVILDNLIAAGTAKPMVVVMPLGYGDMNVVSHGRGALSARGLLQNSMDKFGASLLNEVLPQVEKNYRVSSDHHYRAIAGLSMGGTESVLIGLNHADKFAWVGCFSAGGLATNFAQEFPRVDPKMNEELRLLWISCGDRDNLRTPDHNFYGWVTNQGVNAKWVEIPGEHSFRVWRRNLVDFAPLLFRDRK